MYSPSSPHEVGPNRAANVGQKPRKPKSIAPYGSMQVAGNATGASGPGTPSPRIDTPTTVVGNGGITGAPGGVKKASKVVGPKIGRGPGGIGLTGTGAPWG